MTRSGMLVVLAACSSGDRSGKPTAAPMMVVDAVPGDTVPPAVAAGADAAASVPTAAARSATLERLAWPVTTASFELRGAMEVYAAPDLGSEPLGRISEGTRFPIGDSADGDKHCAVWLAAVPRGWICARYARSSTLPPEAVALPVVPDGELLPHDYFGVKKGAKRYATADDVRATHPRPEPKDVSTYMVTKDRIVKVDGVAYVETPVGLVSSSEMYRFHPSTFAGIDVVATPPPAWPFAWVIAPDRHAITARATADARGAAAGTFAHRAIVPVLEETAGFVRVADGQWIERRDLRVARIRPRPDVDDAAAKWIDLDRDEQVLVAYDGATPVFATLFSSGRHQNDTPPALYRIRSKSAITKMAAEEREAVHYEVSEVPWATRFRSGLYFHAAYWHDGFGNPRSHGCVNLSPADARWVYDWTAPTMPAGWDELEIAVPGSMIVLVHDAKHPDPPVFDYDLEAIQRVKIRREEKRLREEREAAEAEADAAAGATPDAATPPTPTPDAQ